MSALIIIDFNYETFHVAFNSGSLALSVIISFDAASESFNSGFSLPEILL